MRRDGVCELRSRRPGDYAWEVMDLEQRWTARLDELCARIRAAVREPLARAAAEAGSAGFEQLGRALRNGAGDVTFGLDEPAERCVQAWQREVARREPISLLSEDSGWSHMGPGRGGVVELDGFDHGGVRVAIDPIDGTRNLMADLRSAWTVVSFAPPGREAPRLSDLTLGMAYEIPDTRAARGRCLQAVRGKGAWRTLLELSGAGEGVPVRLDTGSDARVDRGYFPFFRYLPNQRPHLARIEAEFFARLERCEGADTSSCYDDQYISSGGQLALLAEGRYRMAADLRAWLGAREPRSRSIATHPYDLAGAVLIAREAGAIVESADGTDLDFAIDCTTPISFVAFANAATRARLRPHLDAALTASEPR